MDVRTFEAFSMRDAVKAVKKALGADAVILSTREKPAPGGKGMLVEVTAAAVHTGRKAGASAEARAAADAAAETSGLFDRLGSRLTALAETAPTRTQVQALEAGMQELKLLLLESLRTKDGSVLQDLPALLVPLDRQLRAMGVNDVCVAELMRHLRAIPLPSTPDAVGESEGYYRDQAIRWLMKRIKIAPRWSVVSGATSFQAMVGPTGVGKSSIVAKLAALHANREKHKVAVVSLDNHRLAAGEQMRIFCKIIGVPFIAAQTAADVAGVADAHRDVELVLVDTAGLSPKNTGGIGELAALKAAGLPVDIHLVLSVTEKESQLDQAIRAYSRLGLASLVFAKLDESWSYGEIYNLSKKWALPLSFFGIGQQIPEDVERATRERVIERLFGL